MTDEQPDPARLAAIDQQLAAMDDRLRRHTRAAMRSDIAVAVLAAAVALYTIVVRPHVSWWVLAAAALAIVLGAAGSFLQNLMLLSTRTEVRDLRARVPARPRPEDEE